MAQTPFRLRKAPIVEAVLEIDCDMPPGFELAAVEGRATDAFRDRYPQQRKQFLHGYRIEQPPDADAQLSAERGLHALQFVQGDERQIVQVRRQGFAFNRLSPYSTLDDYLPEVRRTWEIFQSIASPLQVRQVRLRYINRILLPLTEGRVDLDEYLTGGPRLPDEGRLQFTGFLTQYAAEESASRNQVKVVLTTQQVEGARLPLIFDIEAYREEHSEPGDWDRVLLQVQSLRELKNLIFRRTLTDLCLQLFQ